MTGFITLHRKITEWEWYNDPITKTVFMHLLLTANYKASKWRGVTIERGQCIHGRKEMADALGISEQNVRTALERLKSTSEITINATNKFSLITIVNYEKYQDKSATATSESTSNLTNNQPTTNQQLTTTEQEKQLNKNNKEESSAHAREEDSLTALRRLAQETPNEGLGGRMSLRELARMYPNEGVFDRREDSP